METRSYRMTVGCKMGRYEMRPRTTNGGIESSTTNLKPAT